MNKALTIVAFAAVAMTTSANPFFKAPAVIKSRLQSGLQSSNSHYHHDSKSGIEHGHHSQHQDTEVKELPVEWIPIDDITPSVEKKTSTDNDDDDDDDDVFSMDVFKPISQFDAEKIA